MITQTHMHDEMKERQSNNPTLEHPSRHADMQSKQTQPRGAGTKASVMQETRTPARARLDLGI